MGHCVHIYFKCSAEQRVAFQTLMSFRDVVVLAEDTIRIRDPFAISTNIVVNLSGCLEVQMEVKTRHLSSLIVDGLGQHECLVKDCEDSADEHGLPLRVFLRC